MLKNHTKKTLIRVLKPWAGMLFAAFLSVAALSTVSCNRESGALADSDGGAEMMRVSFRLTSSGTSSGYSDLEGSGYENYIDIAGGDYRVYFFTNDPSNNGNDTFIAEFNPSDFYETSSGSYTTYSMTGLIPNTLVTHSDFKVMILANWGSYPYPTGTTTIDEVCSSGTFACKEGFVPGEDNLIPFYGIQEYTGVTFRAGEITWLDSDAPVNMLRALAKIEVLLDESDMELAGVSLCNYNGEGYCAPAGVYANADYVSESTSGGWTYNYAIMSPHLIGGANDSGEKELPLVQDAAGVWYAYVPEYRNMGEASAAADYAYLQLDLVGYGDNAPNSDEYRLYFIEDGTTPGADRDILRNVVYSFTITLKDYELSVVVDGWEKSFRNDFGFNTDEDNEEGDD